MKKIFYLFLLLLLSCEDSLNNNETIDKLEVQSRVSSNWTVTIPKFIKTGEPCYFQLFGYDDFHFQGSYWSMSPNDGSIFGDSSGATAEFNKGGLHSIRFEFYDFSGNVYYWDSDYFAVYQKAPISILGNSLVDTEGTYTYSVDYPHNNVYTTEWEVSGNAQVQKNSNQINVHFPIAGTYTIKSRAIEVCPQCDGGTYISEWITKEVKVCSHITSDDWSIMNFKGEGRNVSFDLVYKSTQSSYKCFAMYVVYLYKGSYDGYYNSSTWEWEKEWNETDYHPPVIRSEYGFMSYEWDFPNYGGGAIVEKGQIRFFPRYVTMPIGKTVDDIEYAILFIRDSKPKYLYSSTFDDAYLYEN